MATLQIELVSLGVNGVFARKLFLVSGKYCGLHLPGNRSPEPLWLWSSAAGTSAEQVDRAWQAFLRRFDLEHTFRFLKQVLGWTRPRLCDPPPDVATSGSLVSWEPTSGPLVAAVLEEQPCTPAGPSV